MPTGTNIRTYFQGQWHDGDLAVMKAADHGMWLGSNVFDGARYAHGLTPDLDRHCARVNASAEALMDGRLPANRRQDGDRRLKVTGIFFPVPPAFACKFGATEKSCEIFPVRSEAH